MVFTPSQAMGNRHNEEDPNVDSPPNPNLQVIAPSKVPRASRIVPQIVPLSEYEDLKQHYEESIKALQELVAFLQNALWLLPYLLYYKTMYHNLKKMKCKHASVILRWLQSKMKELSLIQGKNTMRWVKNVASILALKLQPNQSNLIA